MGQVLGNVVSNAVEYTPAGKQVMVRSSSRGGKLLLSVEDQGPGIPEAYREKIFQKFWRAPGSGSRGHGLGLFIASKLVAAHRGKIWVEPAAGGGAAFKIEIPH